MDILSYKDKMSSPSIDEVDIIQQARQRSFLHWPYTTPSRAQLITAGFFSYNVSDQVICLYCNLFCHRWTSDTDDPCEVHKILSPKCAYVKSNLIHREAMSISIVNENIMGAISGSCSKPLNDLTRFLCNEFVGTLACNTKYVELAK